MQETQQSQWVTDLQGILGSLGQVAAGIFGSGMGPTRPPRPTDEVFASAQTCPPGLVLNAQGICEEEKKGNTLLWVGAGLVVAFGAYLFIKNKNK